MTRRSHVGILRSFVGAFYDFLRNKFNYMVLVNTKQEHNIKFQINA